MNIKLTVALPGYDQYKPGDTIKDAESIFGVAQTRYLLETNSATPVGEATEKATADKATEKATEKR